MPAAQLHRIGRARAPRTGEAIRERHAPLPPPLSPLGFTRPLGPLPLPGWHLVSSAFSPIQAWNSNHVAGHSDPGSISRAFPSEVTLPGARLTAGIPAPPARPPYCGAWARRGRGPVTAELRFPMSNAAAIALRKVEVTSRESGTDAARSSGICSSGQEPEND